MNFVEHHEMLKEPLLSMNMTELCIYNIKITVSSHIFIEKKNLLSYSWLFISISYIIIWYFKIDKFYPLTISPLFLII